MLLKNLIKINKGQSTVEFTFAMLITAILIVGMVRVFAWTGRDLVERRIAHEDVLTQNVGIGGVAPLKQTTERFFDSAKMKAYWNAQMFDPE